MSKFIVFVFLIFISIAAKAQNIYSALHLNDERAYKTKRPVNIVKTNTFYNSSGKEIHKETDVFDESGMLLMEERFDETGNRTVRMVLVNDTSNRIISAQTFERWTDYGYSKQITSYGYDDKKFLVGITTKDAAGNLITHTQIKNNDKGHPVEMIIFDSYGNPFGKEIATYLYETNQYITSVISNEGAVLSTDTSRLNFRNAFQFPTATSSFNDHGDETKWVSKALNGKETLYEADYTYDQYGNCTEERIYKVKYKSDGKSKRAIERIFKKEYKY